MTDPQTPARPDNASANFDWLLELLAEESSNGLDAHMQWVDLSAGEVLFEQGDPGDSMYVLKTGALGIRVHHDDGRSTIIDQLAPGALVGEMALLSGQPRTATVYAMVDSGLICITQETLDQLTAARPETAESLEATVAPRLRRLQLTAALRPLFGDLDAAVINQLQQMLQWRQLNNGDVLYRQGDRADDVYLVINGRLRGTTTAADGRLEDMGEYSRGQLVGEFAMLARAPRVSTVTALRATTVVEASREQFQALTTQYPQLMGRVTQHIVDRRLHALTTHKPTAPASLSLAVLPAGPGVDSWTFARQLAAALTPHGAALALNSDRLDDHFGKRGAAHSPADGSLDALVANWLDELQAEHSYLVFAADAEPNAWTKRCIDNADRVLLLADPAGDPAPGPAEARLDRMESPIRKELVLWWPPETQQPAGTAAWLDARTTHAHHHIRRDDPAHMDRLARRLSGHAIGLVFSGGAARGFAHLGVLQAIEELAIPIDYLGGTSMGAVLASAYSAMPYEEMVEHVALFRDPKAVFDRTLPITSIMASKKVSRLIRSYFTGIDIEDLWRPFFCVATNLTKAEAVVYTRGPLWRAVRASVAIPGVFTPVMDDGDVLVDGGVLDNFPVAQMAELCESDRIIGVNVAPFYEKKRSYDFDTSISGWRILWSRLNPFSKPIRSPALVGTIMRALEINSVRRSKADEQLVDLMIYPDTGQFGLYDFSNYDPIAAAGYEASVGPLADWQERRGIDEA